jgi:hypothetical protein
MAKKKTAKKAPKKSAEKKAPKRGRREDSVQIAARGVRVAHSRLRRIIFAHPREESGVPLHGHSPL